MIGDLLFWSTLHDTFLERDLGSLRNKNDLQLIIFGHDGLLSDTSQPKDNVE